MSFNIDSKLKSLYKRPPHKRKRAGTSAGRVNFDFLYIVVSTPTMKFIQQNIKPLSLVVACGAIGFMFGHLGIGIAFGVLIVALVTLCL